MARTGVHIFLGILLWVVFGYYWYIVFQRPITPHARLALIAVSSIVAAVTLFLVYWIFHNRRIARRYPRRRNRKTDAAAPENDFLGRPLMMPDPERITAAGYVEVHVVEMAANGEEPREHKVFRTGEPVPE